MSDKKKTQERSAAEDPERTLLTLDQLSQTIEVMSSVVNRLRTHLSDQITAKIETQGHDDASGASDIVEAARSQVSLASTSSTPPSDPNSSKDIGKDTGQESIESQEPSHSRYIVEINAEPRSSADQHDVCKTLH